MIVIDHKNKTISFKDLKTGSEDHSKFLNSFYKYRYFLQGVIYTLAYKEIKKKLNLEDYEEQLFEFLYIGVNEKIPVIFKFTENWIKASLFGFKTELGYYYKGLYQLIEEIEYHHINKIYNISKEVYENKGIINLKEDFIINGEE